MEYDLFLWWDNKSARRGPLPTIPRANLLVTVNKGINGGLVPSGPARHPKQSDLATWITCCVNGAETGLRTVQICFTCSGFRLGVDSQTVLPKKTMLSPAGGRGGEVGLCCSQIGNVGAFSQTWMGFENSDRRPTTLKLTANSSQ